MKRVLWAVAIILAGLLAGFAARTLLDKSGSEDNPAPPAAPATATTQPGDSATGKYRVGEHIGGIEEERVYVPAKEARNGFREMAWEELMPEDWDPMAPFKNLKIEDLDDADPRAIKALEEAKKIWDKAPVNPAVNGNAIRIPGFVVSLDQENADISEFLLVPYFGACIHTPPPPANQIIHVRVKKPLKGIRTMDPVWIQGTLQVGEAATALGAAGYSMQPVAVTPYEE